MANYDPELGGAVGATGGVGAFVRRRLRRPRLIFVGLTIFGLLYYYSDALRPERPPGIVVSPDDTGLGWGGSGGIGGGSGAVDDRPVSKPKPKTKPIESYTGVEAEFIVDENGDHYYPNILTPDAAPLVPNPDDLMDPTSFFPEVGPDFLKRPEVKEYPVADLDKIISVAPPDNAKHRQIDLLPGAYSETWKGPEEWKPTYGNAKPIQWDGFKKGNYETAKERKTREARRDAVKRGFVYAWQKYKDHAWGHDEVKPVTKDYHDPFNG